MEGGRRRRWSEREYVERLGCVVAAVTFVTLIVLVIATFLNGDPTYP